MNRTSQIPVLDFPLYLRSWEPKTGGELSGIVVYLAVALLCAAAVFLFAEWNREPGVPAPDNPGVLAVIAGLVWPVLIIGIVQLAAIAALRAHLRAGSRPQARVRVGSPV